MPRRLRLIQAIAEGLATELERDPRVILLGEDVRVSVFGETRGLFDRFGPDRVIDTPISEATLTGLAVGLAASGYRPVLHMMFANFLYTGFDGIANQMAKLPLMTGGQMILPLTVIASYGAGRSNGAQHSDTPFPALANLGGIEIAAPATPSDAKGLLATAIRSNRPTIYLEPGGRGGERGDVPDGDHATAFGKARVARTGDDVTIVAVGTTVRTAMQAAATLEEAGIVAEVLDLRTIVPLDQDTILRSVAKTGRLVVVDESRDTCSLASHVAAIVAEHAFADLRAPIGRVTSHDIAMPYAPAAEAHVLPSADRIVGAAQGTLSKNKSERHET